MTRLSLLAALLLTLPAAHARADDAERWSLHAQFTAVAQRHDRFASPYAGPNSLRADEGTKTTMDATAYLGLRLWPGGEFYLNPELDRGFGLSNTQGAAGFPSGEAYKVGHHSAYGRLHRAFLRQVFAADDSPTEAQPGAANQLAGPRPAQGLTLTGPRGWPGSPAPAAAARHRLRPGPPAARPPHRPGRRSSAAGTAPR